MCSTASVKRFTILTVFLAALSAWIVVSETAEGFALLGSYSKENARRWPGSYLADGLTYSFDDEYGSGFFGGDSQCKIAIGNAIQTWANAGTLYFGSASYNAVATDDDLLDSLEKGFFGMPLAFEGPDWLGANIDFFSRPDDFEYQLWGQTRQLSGKLAMAEVVTAGSQILSVDIYFNQDYSYTTHGLGGIDLETVALHEIGHAIGLGHPESAPSGRNYNPITYDPEPYESGWQGSIMWHEYKGVRRELELEETGGATFLYNEGTSSSSAVGCVVVNFALLDARLDPKGEDGFFNDSGVFQLSNPDSSCYSLGTALETSGLGVDGQCYFLETGDEVMPYFSAYVVPDEHEVTISFDIALLTGSRIDENAYLVLEVAGDIEIFRLDYADFNISEMTWFDPQKNLEYRTDYLHFDIPVTGIPPEALSNWFDFLFRIEHYEGGAAALHVPEPASILLVISGLPVIALLTLRAKRSRRN